MSRRAAELLSAYAVRDRCRRILEFADRGETRHFRLVPSLLDDVVRRVVTVTTRRYPRLDVPYHSRWRHFTVGGINRQPLVAAGSSDCYETARSMIDLAVVSVLLDAGAGSKWTFTEAQSGQRFNRSEGLAVASLRAMETGLFSALPGNPWRADADALSSLGADRLGSAFQATTENPLVGIDGRVELLRRLGLVAAGAPEIFGTPGRIGNLFDYFKKQGGASIEAADVLGTLIRTFNPIWQGPGRIVLDGVYLGDCGRHSLIEGDGLVPFHKLLQWLAYSLLEPLEQTGMKVVGLNRLTGLGEYRNGGLFVDSGVLVPRHPEQWQEPVDPESEAVVEWRALTVALLDRIAPMVRDRLGLNEEQFPLAKVLEGGTWMAGREIASELRSSGGPPLAVKSDGTWF